MADKVMTSSTLTLPPQLSDEIWKKVQAEAILPRLSGAMPQRFGNTEIMVLKGTPKAEIVGESEAKSASEIEFTTKEVIPVKLHTGIRVTNELLWADKVRKNIIMGEIATAIKDSLVQALDTIGFSGKNPKTGSKATQVKECIFDAEAEVQITDGEEDKAIDEAYIAVVENGYQPRSIAADTSFNTKILFVRDKNGYKMYPNGVNGYAGLNGAVGQIEDDEIVAVVGDFSAFKWGVQEQIGLEVIPYGDPDNTGRDLAGHNEVFVRAEVVYGIGIMDTDAFALVKKAAE